MTTPTPKTLAACGRGERATILAVSDGDVKLNQKFAARGLVPGAEIGILRAGDPLLLAIDESRWAVTAADASQVLVDIRRAPRHSLLQRLWKK